MSWLVVIFSILFLAAGTALAYVVGAAAVLTFIASDNARYLAVLPQRIFSQLDVFALMAMVLFIMTGEVMNRTGVTRYLINFSMSIVGRFKGGLGHVNILTSIFFAGVSGSAVARCGRAVQHTGARHAGAGLLQTVRGCDHSGFLGHRPDHSAIHHSYFLRCLDAGLHRRPVRRRNYSGAFAWGCSDAFGQWLFCPPSRPPRRPRHSNSAVLAQFA